MRIWKFHAPTLAEQGGTVLSDYLAKMSYLAFDHAIGVSEGFWVNVVTGPTNTMATTTTTTTSTSTSSWATTTTTTTSTTLPDAGLEPISVGNMPLIAA
ncbi:hypothetical protein Cenrod_0603 [Candidatus Symbiobacter mobilis CR]|uniref:Uncharacterized protein n=1 Tax=Candidatus Symbiobacter mobilis CR TaxID=946483 RepID=U5N939_9BURK|nr:hypothetical protein Cenrod_0603 [Candidatus Symbiobacter mobilis CR]